MIGPVQTSFGRRAAPPAAGPPGVAPTPPPARPRRGRARRRNLVMGAASALGHAAILLLMLVPRDGTPEPYDAPMVMTVVLAEPPPPPTPPAPLPEPEPRPAPASPPPPRLNLFRLTPTPPPEVKPMPAARIQAPRPAEDEEARPAMGTAEMSEGELAGAATAGAGAAGGACNMAGWLQSKLRQDRRVQAAMADVHRGKAIRVWNGDWVQHPGQEGAGLASVREAIMWEVAFAPEACRRQSVQGLVLISLNDGPGSPRLVVGQGRWRWSDLLFVRPGSPGPVGRP